MEEMLISRAPLRISFGGGGTDFPAYYNSFGGVVVSTTINKYVYVHICPNGASSAQISSADYQTFYRHHCGTPITWEGQLALPRAILNEFGIERGVSVFMASEVPPGTGLGSSSAIAVALIQAVSAYLGRSLSRSRIAELACDVEIRKLGAPIGKQDQYASAFGGLNVMSFSSGGVDVRRLPTPPGALQLLERRLLLFFTGTARDSATILREQVTATAGGSEQTLEGLHRIREIGDECRRCLQDGRVDDIGELMNAGWQQKRRLARGISNGSIDRAYDLARDRGAVGGKITGAGGGGFLLLYCHEANQEAVTDALEAIGLRRMDFAFDDGGVSVAGVTWQPAAADFGSMPSRGVDFAGVAPSPRS